jgi:surface protein
MKVMKKIIILFVSILLFNCSPESEPTMYTLTVTSNPTEGGTINPTGGEYEEGTEVTINVTPNETYSFSNWSGSLDGSESPLIITMDSDINLVGNFTRIPPLYLDENGVTIKVREWVRVGDFHEFNGVQYEVINSISEYYTNPNYDLSKTVLKDVGSMEGWFGEIFVGTPDHIIKFNQDISHWDTSSVTNMSTLFINNSEFNQDISHWDLSNVTSIMGMFFGPNTKFNRDISNWDVSNVNDMEVMFRYNKSFNQDLSNWNVSNVTNCVKFSEDTPQWTKPKPNFTNCDPN